ncbi:MAG: hypothetical protein QNJ23_01485 [Woeseiaceae bacterium]|nr:hypothetical protein [Woeseiaceae bacterium]
MARSIPVLFLVLMAMPLAAQEGDRADPLFQDTAILAVTITGPLKTLVKERPKEDYLDGFLEYTEADGRSVKLDLEIRARGHFRHANCDYPPVLLNLKRKQTPGTLFENQNKLKLVVQCDRSSQFEQAVLREYLAYRILNAVTDKSFRVRPLSITYVDTEKPDGREPRYAFLIEHKKRLGERFGVQDLAIERTAVSALDGAQLNLTSIFGFLIGNTDFSPVAGAPGRDCCHNYVLFGEDGIPQWAVPYDFDMSGLVDAPYATPNERFNLRTVRQRLYRGRCVNNEHVEASLQTFRDNRDAIYALVDEHEGLKPYLRKKVTKYIDDFYELINDPRDVERRILDECI